MGKEKVIKESFPMYVWRQIKMCFTDLERLIFILFLTSVYVYKIFDEGLNEANEYFLIAVVFFFLLYFQFQLLMLLKFRCASTNNWILNSIALIFLVTLSFFFLNLKQITYLGIMSISVFTIITGVTFIVGLLRKK